MNTRAILIALFDRLNHSQVAYVVLRNFSTLPHSISGDLDLLVDTASADRALHDIKTILADYDLIVASRLQNMNGIRIEAHSPSKTAPEKKLIIHLQFWVSFDLNRLEEIIPGFSYKLFLEDLTLQAFTQDGCTFWIPGSRDRFVLLLRQLIFKKRERYRDELAALIDDADVRDFMLATLKDLPKDLKSWIRFESYSSLSATLSILVQAQWGESTLERILQSHFRAMVTSFVEGLPRPAPVIYMAGPDGCGKTSATKMVESMLQDSGIKHKHFYSMKKNFIRSAMISLKNHGHRSSSSLDASPSKPKVRMILMEDITDRNDGSTQWKVRKLINLSVSLQDVFMSYLATLYFRMRGYTIIIETSPYDLFIKYHMPQFRALERIFAPLIPAPSLGLLLVASPDVIHSRKKELLPDEIAHYYSRFEEVLQSGGVSERFSRIRTDIGKDQTLTDLRHMTAQVMAKSHSRWSLKR